MALGARIKEARGELEQGELCARVPGLTQQSLSALEKRDSKTSEFAPGLADALGVSLRWLLSGEGDQRSDWPFVRVTRAQLAALDNEDRLIIEGHLMQALHNLRPHKKGEMPAGVVVIPDRRQPAAKQKVGTLKSLNHDAHPERRAQDKKAVAKK